MIYHTGNVLTVIEDGDVVSVRSKEDGRLLFTYARSAGLLAQQLTAYNTGLAVGVETGKAQMRDEIRQVLGVN